MTVRLVEADDSAVSFYRAVELDAGSPDSEYVFIETARPTGYGEAEERHCFMFDRAAFVAALKSEFGLVDALEVLFA